ncbi:MAG TPA: chorismate mutase [Gammaproteobacteria bacterium]|nr:chorismate mutase [Gammaproteobacteria bacterium]
MAQAAQGEPDLERDRQRIDRLDEALARLLHERVRIALHLGRRKRAAGLPLKVPERETEVLRRVAALSGGSLPEESVQRVFRVIMDETLAAEHAGP